MFSVAASVACLWAGGAEFLDGPFATGTTGRTVASRSTSEWRLNDVVPERRFAITGVTPDGRGALSFVWEFEDDVSGGAA